MSKETPDGPERIWIGCAEGISSFWYEEKDEDFHDIQYVRFDKAEEARREVWEKAIELTVKGVCKCWPNRQYGL